MSRDEAQHRSLATSRREQSEPAALATVLMAVNLGCIAFLAWMMLQLAPDQTAGNSMAPREIAPCVMDQDGYLRGKLYGAVQAELDWQGADMACDGMTRPAGNGLRLVFAQQIDPEQPGIMFVIGLADARLGMPAEELSANVTIIDQRSGRFFSTQTEPRCWVNLQTQLQLSGTIAETWRLSGTLYCASALAALNGAGSVTLSDIEFSGVMKPTAP